MAKRKHSTQSLGGGPSSSLHDQDPSVYEEDDKRMTKRLFSPASIAYGWTNPLRPRMSELLDFILQHEEAFKR